MPFYVEPAVGRWSEDNPEKLVDYRTLASESEAANYPVDGGEAPPSHLEYALEEIFGIAHADDEP
jgi:hypothetical protein